MKNSLFLLLSFSVIALSCKSDKKNEGASVEAEKELSILEKVAAAHGLANWNKVQTLKFTFNVDRDTAHFERSWIWNTKTNEVTGSSLGQTSTYDRAAVDSSAAKIDGAFINDKYWMLAPINIFWDKNNLTDSYTEQAVAPISQDTLQKLTVVYNDEGGYTPGDAYDFYFGEDFMIKEWVFRRGNREEPSTTTTWEDYVDKGGLKIAQMHQNEDGSFKLYFSDISVTP